MIVSFALFALVSAASPMPSGTPGHTYVLTSMNSSGVHGTATLTPRASQTVVALSLTADPQGGEHWAHIHAGTCKAFTMVPAYALRTIVHGTSVTIVDAPIEKLRGFVIEVHASGAHPLPTVACARL